MKSIHHTNTITLQVEVNKIKTLLWPNAGCHITQWQADDKLIQQKRNDQTNTSPNLLTKIIKPLNDTKCKDQSQTQAR